MAATPPAPKCPDCEVAMEEGFIPDAVLGGVCQAHWHRGKPDNARTFSNLLGGGFTWVGTKAMPIRAFRCGKCGLVRSYAFPKVWRKVP